MKLRLITLLVISLSPYTTVIGQNTETKDKIIAFLDLSSVAKSIRSAGAQAESTTKPIKVQSGQPGPSKEQYVALYQALTQLQRTRAGYLTAMDLYVKSVKKNQPQPAQRQRRQAFEDQVRALKNDLAALTTAFTPLQISLDLGAPELSAMIEHYEEARQAKTVEMAPGLIETLSVSDLEQLQGQAVQNGKTLDMAIQNLRDFLKKKYPDLGA